MSEVFDVRIATEADTVYVTEICHTIELAARERGTGIAKRNPAYVEHKIREGKAIIGLLIDENLGPRFAGFCYVETWGDKQYVANSGLIVVPEFRKSGLAKRIKQEAFDLSRRLYPDAKIFGITTSHAVMKINTELGYVPVPFSELTRDEEFWNGCSSCPNYDILSRTNRKMCLCTGMLYDPNRSKQQRKTVVLAFSGGLDTSYCAKFLSDVKGYAVHSVIINTGGFSSDELEEIERRALALGVDKHVAIDETDRFYDDCLKYLIFGNVLRYGTYPLSVSAERVFQAVAIARYAREISADYVAHGSTGAGNDQVRFDAAFNVLLPGVPVITPIRDNTISREAEIDFLKQTGVEFNWEKALYSVNKGLWGTTIGGRETLSSAEFLPDEAFPTPVTKTEAEEVVLNFVEGELVGINGEELSPVAAITRLSEIAQPFGIGRDIHIGDTIIGIKGRVGFEAAAPVIILKAHHTLEKHVLTKQQLSIKENLATNYGAMLHEGAFLEPAMRNIEHFLQSTQRNVTGDVRVRLAPYRFYVEGIESGHDLMSAKFGKYGEINTAWTGDDVRGYTKIASNQAMMYYSVNGLGDVL